MTKKDEFIIISQIAKRAKSMGHPDDLLTINMDIEAVHQEAPLKLKELLEADDLNFSHDIFGIRNNINRRTKKLENCFSPRFAA